MFLRNIHKKFALSSKHIFVLVLKITCDCVGKSLIAFVFIYSVGNGKFSTLLTLGSFYSIAGIMMIFHLVCTNSPAKELWSRRQLFGEMIFKKDFIIIISYIAVLTGIILNSLSSVLTYTDMDLASIQGKTSKACIRRHQSTFIKQLIYLCLVFFIQIG